MKSTLPIPLLLALLSRKRKETMRSGVRIPATVLLSALIVSACSTIRIASAARRTLSLDGPWQIAEGKMDPIPADFSRTVPVPGLVDMATPAFVEPGPKVANRRALSQKDPKRDAFWYRRTFTLDGAVPAVARLKVAKAMFGTRVFLNGTLLGDHWSSFTPGYFDAKPALKTGENELIVRVGADRDALKRECPDGFDFEKERYIPGIFDSVELILSGTPHFVSVQAAPDIVGRTVRVQAVLRNHGEAAKAVVQFVVREAKSGAIAGALASESVAMEKNAETTVDVRIPLKDGRLWSPEDPFLYTLESDTGTDHFRTQFGMREFKFDPSTGRAMLNGKPYFMRGSNITLYRFFEDPARGALPWDKTWVRTLHRRAKTMNWNCFRYCIGFPPEFWYEIADEEGFLIQDEFPIWFSVNTPKELRADELATEYAEWMRERWNHPGVVIWDACNETRDNRTGAAMKQVRKLDLSNRPWDNGYNYPQEPGDCFESHPYHFIQDHYKLKNLAGANPVPHDNVIKTDMKHAVVINEYGWLWLNRDGTPTTLTRKLYQNLLGTNSTTAERFQLQARYMAAETEFWRVHRKAAAVMHFTMLGYARPDGQTSDHWQDVRNLVWEPQFLEWTPDSFAPVSLMVNCFEAKGSSIPVILINDLEKPWQGPVTIRVSHNGKVISEQVRDGKMGGYGTATMEFPITWPIEDGEIRIEARMDGAGGKPVRSRRIFKAKPVADPVTSEKTVSASSAPKRRQAGCGQI